MGHELRSDPGSWLLGSWVLNDPSHERHSTTAKTRLDTGTQLLMLYQMRICDDRLAAQELLLLRTMSKTRKRSRRTRRENTDRSATVDVVTQLECAIRRPQATLIGALVGGLVPWFARTLAHDQLPAAWASNNDGLAAVMLAVVLGCALFSAITVYKFGRATFGCAKKALGFVLAIEGVMLVSTGATSNVALAVLIAINALANGASISLAREATCKRREADARRAATRASKSRGSRVKAPVESPIVIEDATDFSRSRARRPAAAPRWNPTMHDDVIDAEIVSEQRLLA